MKNLLSITILSFFTVSAASALANEPAPPQPGAQRMELTNSTRVLPSPELDARNWLDCAAQAGDGVWLLETVRGFGGVVGAIAGHVKFIDGSCAGREGYVGRDFLKPQPTR
jgi:hypothetical protein